MTLAEYQINNIPRSESTKQPCSDPSALELKTQVVNTNNELLNKWESIPTSEKVRDFFHDFTRWMHGCYTSLMGYDNQK